MNPRALGLCALAAFGLLAATDLLTQLSQRADRAADLASPVRNDVRSVTVLFDRAADAAVLDGGWNAPTVDQGVTSNARTAGLRLPTSTAAGDVELTLVLASGPRTTDQTVSVRVGDAIIGVWTPRGDGEETVRFTAPRRARSLSYQLNVVLDLAGATPPPIRALRASTRILRPPA